LVNWSIGGIQPPTQLHRDTLSALHAYVSKTCRLRATHCEVKVLQLIAARYRTRLYPENLTKNMEHVTYHGNTCSLNQRVGLKQTFLCRTDYVYATKTASYPCIPKCQSVWKYVRSKRSRRAKDMIRQSQWTNDIISITSLYASGGVPQTYHGKKIGSSRRGRRKPVLKEGDPLFKPRKLRRRRRQKKPVKVEKGDDSPLIFSFCTDTKGTFAQIKTEQSEKRKPTRTKRKTAAKRKRQSLRDKLRQSIAKDVQKRK